MTHLTKIPGFRTEVLLAPYTTWKIGGPAEYFWEPELEQLPVVMEICRNESIPVHILGRGSNVLIEDKGVKGVVICTKKRLQEITYKSGIIEAESGVPLPALAKYAAKQGIGGFEFLIGIPGTVGGGIVINAGLTAKRRLELSDLLIEVEILNPDGRREWKKREELAMRYRSSNLLDQGIFVLRARFRSTHQKTEEEIRHQTAIHLADRRRKQPLGKATAGSTFKQPEDGKAAGWYIDRAGLKGFEVNGAVVSRKHANWIENRGSAGSNDVRRLMDTIVRKVSGEFGVQLEKEVRFIP